MTFFNLKYESRVNNSFRFNKNSLISDSKSRTYFKVLNINKLKHLNNSNKLFKITHRECLTINITKDEPRIVILNSSHHTQNKMHLRNVTTLVRPYTIAAPSNTSQFIMDDFMFRNNLCLDNQQAFENEWNEHEM